MQTTSHSKAFLTTVGVVAVLFPLAACSVDLTRGESGKSSEVDIRTPAGDMSVRRDVNAARDIGLPIYPGAVPVRDRGEESGNVNIGTAWFGLKVAAAKFESDDAPERVLDYTGGR